jgi:hypothetical protein
MRASDITDSQVWKCTVILVTFKVGIKAWLSTRHNRTTKPSTQHDNKLDGPYTVSKVINQDAYQLGLPKTSQITMKCLFLCAISNGYRHSASDHLNSIQRCRSILQNTSRIIRSKQIDLIDWKNTMKSWRWSIRCFYSLGSALSTTYENDYVSGFGILGQWDNFIGVDCCCNVICQKLAKPRLETGIYVLVTCMNLEVEGIGIGQRRLDSSGMEAYLITLWV